MLPCLRVCCAVFFVVTTPLQVTASGVFLCFSVHIEKNVYLCTMNDNLDSRSISAQEKDIERALRPSGFDSFAGQRQVVENLKVFVRAAKERGEPLDHVLLYGPPGLGKTTLSNIIANELGVRSI